MGLADWWRNRGRDLRLYPENENGEVLWQMHKAGDDLSKVRAMEFAFLFPAKENACAFEVMATSARRSVSVTYFDKKAKWEVLCTQEMVPSHRAVTSVEADLSRLAKLQNGVADGWGCMAQ